MDPYKQFKVMIYIWLRFVGLVIGHDMFKKKFRINFYYIFVIIWSVVAPAWYLWTIYNFGGDLALKAMSYIAVAFKVYRKIVV